MPQWYFDRKELRETPSMLAGIDADTEARYRREGVRFIITVGSELNLSLTTMATGVVYFHRFYMVHNFKEFPRYPMACACVFLAGKVEETPKKCKDVVRTARNILPDAHFIQFTQFSHGGDDTRNSLEEVMTLEKILLQSIKFELQVEHPYTFLVKYAKCLKGESETRLQKMVQMAWTFINDSLCTTLCLQWEPEIIAIALIHLAGKLTKFDVKDWNDRAPEHLRWWDMFVQDMAIEHLEEICHQVLDLYTVPQEDEEVSQRTSPQPNASPPAPPAHHHPQPHHQQHHHHNPGVYLSHSPMESPVNSPIKPMIIPRPQMGMMSNTPSLIPQLPPGFMDTNPYPIIRPPMSMQRHYPPEHRHASSAPRPGRH